MTHPFTVEDWAEMAHQASAEIAVLRMPDQALQRLYDDSMARLVAIKEKENGNR